MRIAVGNFSHTYILNHKAVFGKPADSLEKNEAQANSCERCIDQCDKHHLTTAPATDMISDREMLVNKYISVPKEMSTHHHLAAPIWISIAPSPTFDPQASSTAQHLWLA